MTDCTVCGTTHNPLKNCPPDEVRISSSDRDVLRRILIRADHNHPGNLERTITAILGNGFARPDHDAPDFFAWADASPAVTWGGRLGLKERWEHRDDPEYQRMLRNLEGGK